MRDNLLEMLTASEHNRRRFDTGCVSIVHGRFDIIAW